MNGPNVNNKPKVPINIVKPIVIKPNTSGPAHKPIYDKSKGPKLKYVWKPRGGSPKLPELASEA
jgi:hypothetical protein